MFACSEEGAPTLLPRRVWRKCSVFTPIRWNSLEQAFETSLERKMLPFCAVMFCLTCSRQFLTSHGNAFAWNSLRVCRMAEIRPYLPILRVPVSMRSYFLCSYQVCALFRVPLVAMPGTSHSATVTILEPNSGAQHTYLVLL